MKASATTITPEQLAMHRAGLPVAINERIAAIIMGRSVKRLQNERLRQVGLPVLKDGRSVRYLLSDCLAAIEQNRRAG